MKRVVPFFILIFSTLPAWAVSPEPKSVGLKTLQDTMHDFARELEKLHVFSTRESQVQKEKALEMEQELTALNKKIQELKVEALPAAKSYRVSLKALQTHMAETERMYRVGNKQYARWMLNATTSLCVMCHTQLPESKGGQSFWTYQPASKAIEDQFHEAEFLFITRRFDQAIPRYDSLIRGYPGNKLNTVDLDNALRRKAAYFARVKRDPKAGLESFEADLKNKGIPEAIRLNVEAWVGLLRKWTKEKDPDIASVSGKQLMDFVKKQFQKTLWDKMVQANDPRVITHLRVSGLLYEYLFTRPTDSTTPEVLLYLGRTENSLNNQFFYSLGDLYLRECMDSYPKSPTAKECFKELERSIDLSYTGTMGKQLPPEIESELSNYRERVGLKK